MLAVFLCAVLLPTIYCFTNKGENMNLKALTRKFETIRSLKVTKRIVQGLTVTSNAYGIAVMFGSRPILH